MFVMVAVPMTFLSLDVYVFGFITILLLLNNDVLLPTKKFEDTVPSSAELPKLLSLPPVFKTTFPAVTYFD